MAITATTLDTVNAYSYDATSVVLEPAGSWYVAGNGYVVVVEGYNFGGGGVSVADAGSGVWEECDEEALLPFSNSDSPCRVTAFRLVSGTPSGDVTVTFAVNADLPHAHLIEVTPTSGSTLAYGGVIPSPLHDFINTTIIVDTSDAPSGAGIIAGFGSRISAGANSPTAPWTELTDTADPNNNGLSLQFAVGVQSTADFNQTGAYGAGFALYFTESVAGGVSIPIVMHHLRQMRG